MKKLFLMFLTITIKSQNNFDENYYYRLTTAWQGPGKSLDIINDGKNTKLQLAKTGNFTGQFWKIKYINNGFYRLTTAWQGEDKSLDVINDGKNTKLQLAKTGNFSGQFWLIKKINSKFYRLTTQWQGKGKSLDVINDGKNNKLQLAKTGNFSGQYWKLEKLNFSAKRNFSIVFVSDTQYPWTDVTDNAGKESKSVKKARATVLNQNHVKSINSLVGKVEKLKGAIFNGDLTAFGHDWQLDEFKRIWRNLKVKKYMGLGNHDYANNVDQCYQNNCVDRMVDYMKDHIKSLGVKGDYYEKDFYEFPSLVKETNGSLAYSWNLNHVHFVQLQNFPLYQKSWSNYIAGDAKRLTYNIKNSLNWLDNDLSEARKNGKAIILNYHDSEEHWKDGYTAPKAAALKKQFLDIIKKYEVTAVFCGHFHKIIGKRGDYDGIPIFYSGAASQSTYLLAEFTKDKMIIEKVSSLKGASTRTNVGTYSLIKPVKNLPPTPKNGKITFFNEGGYVAKFLLTYKLNGKKVSIHTGNMALGNKKSYDIPGNATNVYINGKSKTFVVWNPWKTIFNKWFKNVPNKCYKVYGTSLNPSHNTSC